MPTQRLDLPDRVIIFAPRPHVELLEAKWLRPRHHVNVSRGKMAMDENIALSEIH